MSQAQPDNQQPPRKRAKRDNSTIVDYPGLPAAVGGISAWVGRPVWNEFRKPAELRKLRASSLWRGEDVPQGHGRPLLIVPGFLANPTSAVALEHILNNAGWTVRVAAVGRNAGPAISSVDACLRAIDSLIEATGEKVAIIGHSRGGQFGRVIAVEHPELVRQVIAVGCPMRTKYPKYLVVKVPAEVLDRIWRSGVLGRVDPQEEEWVDSRRYLPFPDSVELVSVYSRSDGVIDWRLCLDPAAVNIEVTASHQGLFNSIGGVSGIARALGRHSGHFPITGPG